MKKIFFSLFLFIIVGCNANESFIYPLSPDFETVSFEVVQKKLIIEEDIPDNLRLNISRWFNEKVKINGFDGDLTFTIFNFEQTTTPINEGKRVDVSVYFTVLLDKENLSQKQIIKGSVSAYGELTGDFSLNEFDTVVKNTQINLVQRLSKKLKSKI